MLRFVLTINIQMTEFNLGDFEKYVFKTGWCLDAYEPISFKLGVMKDMTKFYIFIFYTSSND